MPRCNWGDVSLSNTGVLGGEPIRSSNSPSFAAPLSTEPSVPASDKGHEAGASKAGCGTADSGERDSRVVVENRGAGVGVLGEVGRDSVRWVEGGGVSGRTGRLTAGWEV
jgi:hypothetical protein